MGILYLSLQCKLLGGLHWSPSFQLHQDWVKSRDAEQKRKAAAHTLCGACAGDKSTHKGFNRTTIKVVIIIFYVCYIVGPC